MGRLRKDQKPIPHHWKRKGPLPCEFVEGFRCGHDSTKRTSGCTTICPEPMCALCFYDEERVFPGRLRWRSGMLKEAMMLWHQFFFDSPVERAARIVKQQWDTDMKRLK